MTDRERPDPLFDLGGLPGGDILFTDPTASSYADPAPTAAVPPPGGIEYRPDPAPAALPAAPSPQPAPTGRSAKAPTLPARWPRLGNPAAPRRSPAPSAPSRPSAPSGPTRPTSPTTSSRPGAPRSRPVRRRSRKSAWPLVLILFWGGPAAIRAITHSGSDSGSSSQSSSAVSAPADGGVLVNTGDMTVLRPHSINPSSSVTIHVGAPDSGSYTITDNGAPVATEVAGAFDYPLSGTQEADEILVAASDDSAAIRCEIRDATGQVVATGEATGTLDCAYDPSELLE
ncbi:MAG: hypothetical protein ABI131_02515 [Nostocoides sp.]